MTAELPSTRRDRDTALLRRMAEGDRAAADTFCRLYHEQLKRRFLRSTQSQSIAEDLAQEVLTKVLAHPGSFEARNDATPETWLYRIARNTGISSGWKRSRELKAIQQDDGVAEQLPASAAHDPERHAIYREAVHKLETLLTERQINILFLKHDSGLTDEAAAVELGVSEATLKRDYRAARDRLQKEGLLGLLFPTLEPPTSSAPAPGPPRSPFVGGAVALLLAFWHWLRVLPPVVQAAVAVIAGVFCVVGLVLIARHPGEARIGEAQGAVGDGERPHEPPPGRAHAEVNRGETGEGGRGLPHSERPSDPWTRFAARPLVPQGFLFIDDQGSPLDLEFMVQADGTATIRQRPRPTRALFGGHLDNLAGGAIVSRNGQVRSTARNILPDCDPIESLRCEGVLDGPWAAFYCQVIIQCSASEPLEIAARRTDGYYLIGRRLGDDLMVGNAWSQSGSPMRTWFMRGNTARRDEPMYNSGWWPIDAAQVLNHLCETYRRHPVCQRTPAASISFLSQPGDAEHALLMVNTSGPWSGIVRYRQDSHRVPRPGEDPVTVCNFSDPGSSLMCVVPLAVHDRYSLNKYVEVRSERLTFRDHMYYPYSVDASLFIRGWSGITWHATGAGLSAHVEDFGTAELVARSGLGALPSEVLFRYGTPGYYPPGMAGVELRSGGEPCRPGERNCN